MLTDFVPPVYPFARLEPIRAVALERFAETGGIVDCSVGTPCDRPSQAVLRALGSSGTEQSYPAPEGSLGFRAAIAEWLRARLDLEIAPEAIGGCVGTKELIAALPGWLRLANRARDTVLYPELSYPTYEMGALLGQCRPVRIPLGDRGRLDLGAIAATDIERALCLFVNSPGNPAGQLEDLEEVAAFGRLHGIPVISDECYVDFTWQGPPRSILQTGQEGVLAVHSLSKRSNLAGLRVGFYSGDRELVSFLTEIRRHAGLMVPGPAQAAAIAAYGEDLAVTDQRARYNERLRRLAEILRDLGVDVELPAGGFYLWAETPQGAGSDRRGSQAVDGDDDWALTRFLAKAAGLLASPGEFYGPAGRGHIRLAAVQPIERFDLVESRLSSWRGDLRGGRRGGIESRLGMRAGRADG